MCGAYHLTIYIYLFFLFTVVFVFVVVAVVVVDVVVVVVVVVDVVDVVVITLRSVFCLLCKISSVDIGIKTTVFNVSILFQSITRAILNYLS